MSLVIRFSSRVNAQSVTEQERTGQQAHDDDGEPYEARCVLILPPRHHGLKQRRHGVVRPDRDAVRERHEHRRARAEQPAQLGEIPEEGEENVMPRGV